MRPYYEEIPDRLRVIPTDGYAFPEHLHPQVELFYLFEGRASMLVDGRTLPMEAGDLCVCFPGVIHGYLEPEQVRALMVIFGPEFAPDFSASFARYCPENPLVRARELPADLELCMRQIWTEGGVRSDDRALKGYLQVVLARAIPRLSLTERKPEVSDIAYRILKYLSAHFTEPMTLEDLSQALNVSPSHLSHTFAQRFGTHFRSYINALRIDHACTLLDSTDKSVTYIAYECGFESHRTFDRAFFNRMGVSPSQYRRDCHRPAP